jgi:8-amino-7-oxononanoate synthase
MRPSLSPSLRLAGRTHVDDGKQRLLYFGGCDYFRFSRHPRVLQAIRSTLRRDGLSVAASRTTTGNHPIYETLEGELAAFFKRPASVLLPNGYSTNLAVGEALAGRYSAALIDERAHGSLWQAAERLHCRVLPFRHRDPAGLAKVLQTLRRSDAAILLTDGMFALTGFIAPLAAYRALLPRNAVILVDDAHGAGVHGANGRGTVELEGLATPQLIQTVTLSKAFGAYGGAVLGSSALCTRVKKRSPTFQGSTPLPLPLAEAARVALRLLHQEPQVRQRLDRNRRALQGRLRQAGVVIPDSPSPILALELRRRQDAPVVVEALRARLIYPSFVRYGPGPAYGCFRFVLSSAHSRVQVDELASALLEVKDRLRAVS